MCLYKWQERLGGGDERQARLAGGGERRRERGELYMYKIIYYVYIFVYMERDNKRGTIGE